MAGEGKILRTAREEKGWSLMDAEEATKIRVRYLQALEEENYAILPGTAYSKGFLRTYANHLNLDPEEMIGLYKASVLSDIPPALQSPLTPIKSRPIWFRPAVAVGMAFLAIALVIGIAQLTHKPGQSVSSGYTPSPLPSAPKTQEPAQKTTPAASQPKTTNPSQPVGSTTGGTTPATTASASSGLTAKLVFTQDVWLNVQVDGNTPVQTYYHAGTTKEITASNKIELLTVGNAGGLSITINGKPVPPLGGDGQVLNNIIFDKAHFG